METPAIADVWAVGDAYEPYVGRWSRAVAREFVARLAVPAEGRWLDVGCGTGALSRAVLEVGSPKEVVGVDPAIGFVAYAQRVVTDPRARFEVGDACALPFATEEFDAVVSGLVLNFMPDPARAVTEMTRVARIGGVVGAYVWDYAGGMELMRHFWEAAVALNPAAANLDEGRRFSSVSSSDFLVDVVHGAGLGGIEACAIDVPTVFRDFDDYWVPFLGGQGPAPSYTMSLSEEDRGDLRERIRAGLPVSADGSISLSARAWAVRGER